MLFRSHLLLARAVARHSAIRRTDENLSRIMAAAQAYEDALPSNDVYKIYGADLALHREISLSCHSYFTRKFHDLSIDCGRRAYVLHYYPAFGRNEAELSLVEHQELVEAIEERDADRADAAMAQHVRTELEVIKNSLDPAVGYEMDISAPTKGGGGKGR